MDAQGAHAPPDRELQPRPPPGAQRRLVRDPPRGVLRRDRPQRKRQEHAAALYRGHPRAGRRRDRRRRSARAVHRAGRGLPPAARGPGQRRGRGNPDGAAPSGGAAAFPERDQLRRARGLRRDAARQLLLGDAGSPRLLHVVPGRRRPPAVRRGPGRGRRALPAQVHGHLRAPDRPRAHDRLRDPQPGHREEVRRPGPAARPRRGGRARRAGRRARGVRAAQPRAREHPGRHFGADCRSGGAAGARAPGVRGGRRRAPGSRVPDPALRRRLAGPRPRRVQAPLPRLDRRLRLVAGAAAPDVPGPLLRLGRGSSTRAATSPTTS